MESLAKCTVQNSRPDARDKTKRGGITSLPRPRPKELRSLYLCQLLPGTGVSLFDLRRALPPSRFKQIIHAPPTQLKSAVRLQTRSVTESQVACGRAVDALREFFPQALREAWPQELLSEEVVFQDAVAPQFGLAPFHAYGKNKYNALMWFLRFYAHLLCKQTKVEMLRFWQPSRETVIVRWSMKLHPRVIYNVYGTTVQIDGVSELKLDSQGRIYQHRVDMTDRHRIKFDLNFKPFAKHALQKTTLLGAQSHS